jgi:cell volume regulation protein A
MMGLPGGETIFDVVFFVVLVSALLQGWTLAPLARRLGLDEPGPPPPPVTLEITSLRHVHGDIVQYTLPEGGRVNGQAIRDLALPDGAVVAMIARANRVIPPRGSTRLLPGDHVFLVLTPEARPLVDRTFSATGGVEAPLPEQVEFPLRGDTTVADLEEFYGIPLEADPACTLEELLRMRLGSRLAEGRGISLGGVKLHVRIMADDRVEQVGLIVVPGESTET